MPQADANKPSQKLNADPAVGAPQGGEDELFIVAGLGADAQDDLGDITADLSTVLAPLDAGDASVRDEIYAFEETEPGGAGSKSLEEVELGAAAGELAAVEPPKEALEVGEPELEAAGVGADAIPEPLEIRKRRFKPWMAFAAAAVVVIVVGWFALFRKTSPLPVDTTPPVAHVPTHATPPEPAPVKVEPACAPNATEPNLVASVDFADPEVAPAVAFADAPDSDPSLAEGTPVDPNATMLVRSGPFTGSPRDPSAAGAGMLPIEVLHAVGRGGDVVVHLRNGNFFAGRVAQFNEEHARIRVPKGEIGFFLREVEAIVPTADEKTTTGPEAVVKLNNGNHIAGRLGEERDGELAIVVGQARIKVPRASIARVELRPPTGVMLGDPVVK